MDEFTWWTAASVILLVSTATFAVMAWEYRRRSKEMELSWRFDNLEQSIDVRLNKLKQESATAVRDVWSGLDNLEERFTSCCQAKNCANKR